MGSTDWSGPMAVGGLERHKLWEGLVLGLTGFSSLSISSAYQYVLLSIILSSGQQFSLFTLNSFASLFWLHSTFHSLAHLLVPPSHLSGWSQTCQFYFHCILLPSSQTACLNDANNPLRYDLPSPSIQLQWQKSILLGFGSCLFQFPLLWHQWK